MNRALSYILVGAGILTVVGVTVYSASAMSKNGSNKGKLIDQIFAKYADPKSPDYNSNFDAGREGLMRYDEDTLKRILSGEIK